MGSSLRACPAVAVVFSLASALAMAGVNVWTTTGPEGGDVVDIAFGAGGRVVLATGTTVPKDGLKPTGRVFVSDDSGATWRMAAPVPVSFQAALGYQRSAGGGVAHVWSSPVDRDTLIAGTDGYDHSALLRSVDGGASWTPVGPDSSGYSMEVLDLDSVPSSPATLWASTAYSGAFPERRVLRSTDTGETWVPVGGGLPGDIREATMAAVSSLEAWALAPSALYRTADGGVSWVPVLAGSLRSLAVAPGPVPRIYVVDSAQAQLLHSNDGGVTWQPAALPASPWALAVSPHNPDEVWLSASSSGWRSTDAGATWTQVAGLVGATLIAADPGQPGRLLAASSLDGLRGLRASDDGGATWISSNRGLRAAVESVAPDPSDPSVVLAGGAWSGFRTTDGGLTWSPADRAGMPDPHVPGRFLSWSGLPCCGGFVYRSTDHGASWEPIAALAAAADLRPDPVTPGLWYATEESGSACFLGGIRRSLDGGVTWTSALAGRGCSLVAPSWTPGRVYAACDSHFMAGSCQARSWLGGSADAGETWGLGTDWYQYRVRLLESAPGAGSAPPRLYTVRDPLVPGQEGLPDNWVGSGFSRNDGWSLPSNATFATPTALAFDPADPSILYLSSVGANVATGPAVFRSSNAGGTWFPITRGLETNVVHDIAITEPGVLWAATSHGVYSIRLQLQPPVAITGPASNVARTAARLEGAVRPRGWAADAWFEWGATPDYGFSTPRQRLGSSGGTVQFRADVEALTCGQVYHFRAAAEGPGGLHVGADQTFTPSCVVRLSRSVEQAGLSHWPSGWRYFSLVVPAGATNLSFWTAGGDGNADLYVRLGAVPDSTIYSCRSAGPTNDESCTVALPVPGTWYVGVFTATGYWGITLGNGYEQESGEGFHTLTPCRVVDTRRPDGPLGGPVLASYNIRAFDVAGACGIPADAKAVSLNVTAVAGTAVGSLRLFPGDRATAPVATAVAWTPGKNRASNAVVRLAADGSGTIKAQNDSAAPVHLLLDVNGYFR